MGKCIGKVMVSGRVYVGRTQTYMVEEGMVIDPVSGGYRFSGYPSDYDNHVTQKVLVFTTAPYVLEIFPGPVEMKIYDEWAKADDDD